MWLKLVKKSFLEMSKRGRASAPAKFMPSKKAKKSVDPPMEPNSIEYFRVAKTVSFFFSFTKFGINLTPFF